MGVGVPGPQKCDDGALQRDEMASGLKVTGDISGFRAEDGDTVSESDDSGQGYWYRRHSLRLADRRRFATQGNRRPVPQRLDTENVDATSAKLMRATLPRDSMPTLTF